jgi:hypothetical protein
MKAITTIIATTNDIILEGESDYIGSATMCINVPKIDATKATKLYELDANITQYSNHWRIQIAKKHIKEVKFYDEL